MTSKRCKRLGIIGGLGPETSCKFCLNLNNRLKKICNKQPDICLENLPISSNAEKRLINGGISGEHLALMMGAVERFNRNKVDMIAIPCNTAHIFIDRLTSISDVPILNMIEECAERCRRENIKKVGLLASTKTLNTKVYDKELDKQNIILITPSNDEQIQISEIILKIINNTCSKTDATDALFLREVIAKFKEKGAEAVILGCTDLPLLIKQEDSALPLINSLEILEDAVIEFMTT